MITADDIAQCDFTDPQTIRLISTAYINEPAITPLADDEIDLAFLEEIEGLSSARLSPTLPRPDGVHAEELLTEVHGYGWTYVNAAFCYTRSSGNRFNGAERGAWYATYGENAAQTAKAEVSFHLTRELDATGVYENVTAYRELIAGFTTRLYDLHGHADEPFLSLDIDTAYPEGQRLAREILGAGGNGVLYPSLRHEGGACLAAFRPIVVQNIRQGPTWTFTWAGERTPLITNV